jgi:uncharacterized membrane protein YjfL (UPF0719 family)
MSPLAGLLIAWGILTGVLIILLIYRSTLTIREDDSLYLNESESHMEKEQSEILAKMRKIAPIVKVLGALSGAMILVIVGLFIYQGLSMQTTPQ